MDPNVAGWCAIAAGVVMVASAIFLLAFFSTGRERFGRLNDLTGAVFAVLLGPAIIVLGERMDQAPLDAIVVVSGLAAIGLVAATSLLTAAGKLTVSRLLAWQGGSFGLLLGWIALASIVGLATGTVPPGLAAIGVVAGILAAVAAVTITRMVGKVGAAAVTGLERPTPILSVAAIGAAVALPIWSVWLGLWVLELV